MESLWARIPRNARTYILVVSTKIYRIFVHIGLIFATGEAAEASSKHRYQSWVFCNFYNILYVGIHVLCCTDNSWHRVFASSVCNHPRSRWRTIMNSIFVWYIQKYSDSRKYTNYSFANILCTCSLWNILKSH